MIIKNKKSTKKEEMIDREIERSCKSDSDWERPLSVQPKSKPTSIRLSNRTIERAKFFAKVHHTRGYQSWIKNIIEERINTEYELYKRIKREIV